MRRIFFDYIAFVSTHGVKIPLHPATSHSMHTPWISCPHKKAVPRNGFLFFGSFVKNLCYLVFLSAKHIQIAVDINAALLRELTRQRHVHKL